jgi:hypothetical protein
VTPSGIIWLGLLQENFLQNQVIEMKSSSYRGFAGFGTWVIAVTLGCLLPIVAGAQSEEKTAALQALNREREMLTAELEQYQKTLTILQTDGTPAEQSPNPAVRKLAQEVVAIKERLVALTEREVTLLQEQIIAAKSRARERDLTEELASAEPPPSPDEAMESKPLRTHTVDYTLNQEAENVERLHGLLEAYHAELQDAARVLPSPEELEARQLAQRDAETLAMIPFSVDKVRLNGAEGSTALAHITERLMDPRIPESRRDIAPIVVIRTRLFDTLVGSESRSLRPVGKNNYIARVRLQPGDTSLSIMSDRWEMRLPQHASASDFLITLHRPANGPPELHVFAVDDLLAAEKPHIPAWLPDDLDLKTDAG